MLFLWRLFSYFSGFGFTEDEEENPFLLLPSSDLIRGGDSCKYTFFLLSSTCHCVSLLRFVLFYNKTKAFKWKPSKRFKNETKESGWSVSPLWVGRWVHSGCCPRQRSCPGSDVRNSHGFSASCLLEACGRTCIAPLVCTGKTKTRRNQFSIRFRSDFI